MLFDWDQITKFLVFALFLLGPNDNLEAQTLSFHHYSAEDGLPSSSLYDMAFDKDGFLWIIGEGGISKFDGHQFIKSPIGALAKDEVIKMVIDQNGRQWMLSLSGRFSYFDNESLHFIDDLESIDKYDYVEIYDDNFSNVWFTDINHIYVLPYKDGVYENSIRKLESFKEEGYKIIASISDNSVLILTAKGVYRFKDFEYTYNAFEQALPGNGPRFGTTEGDSVIFCVENRFYSYDSKIHQVTPMFERFNDYFDEGIISFFKEENGNYWIATKNGLVHLEKVENGYRLFKYLDGIVMGIIVKDHEGNYWFSTEKEGMFFLPSAGVKVIEGNIKRQLSTVKTNRSGQIILGYLDNHIEVLNPNFQSIYQDKLFEFYYRMYDLLVDSIDNCYFFTSRGFVQLDTNFKAIFHYPEFGFKSASFDPDGQIWFSTAGFGGYLTENGANKLVNYRSYSVLPIGADKAWFGTVKGLCLYEGGEANFVKNDLLLQDIRDIEKDEEGNLWVATQGNGLLHYSPQEDSVLLHLTIQNGLLSNNCKKVLLDDEDIWLVTSKGLNKIALGNMEVLSLNNNDGLPSFETNDIFKSDNQFYVATNKGLAIFNDSLKLKRKPPLLYITAVKIEERDTFVNDSYVLAYDQNNVKIEFVGVAYRHAKDVKYRYKMDQVDDDWVESSLTTAQYPSMPSGEFNFYVKAKTVNSDWSDVKKISFNIQLPFWKTTWFILLMILMTLIAIGIIGGLIIRNIKRTNEKDRKIRAAQLTALRAQMNPHFVFNALNSIQDFILQNDSREANRYLSMFARLMRNVLHFSDTGKISLKKEIESIDLYLNLEGLRLGKEFEYFLDIDKLLNLETIQIPPMLIQPFAENAIKHGLMHKNGDKKLYLRFYKKEEQLICEIEDNGIGRQKSMEIRLENPKIYPSKAISLTRERLQLLNSNSTNNFEVEIEDLKDKNGLAVGTKVLVVIDRF